MKDPEKIADFLDRILPASGRIKSGQEFMNLYQEWRWVAGDRLAGHSSVKTLEQGVLVVDVDHPGWLQMFQMEEEKILQRARNRFPELTITKIRIRLVENLRNSPDYVPGPPRESKPLEDKANPELLTALEGLKKSLQEKKK